MEEGAGSSGNVAQRPPPPPSPLTGCYLLIVVGEPHSDRHKELILQQLAQGLLTWDCSDCHVDLERELQAIVSNKPDGDEARFGERLVQFATENLVTEILVHPQLNTLQQCMKNLLSSFTKHRHIIHAGYSFKGNGSWILQDGTISLSDMVEALHEPEVLRVLRAYEGTVSVFIHCAAEGKWSTQRLQSEPVSKLCRVIVNPPRILPTDNVNVASFLDYVSGFLLPASLSALLQPTDVVGNIRFTHPTLYVFPGGQGDAALFGINGFNMLVDGGFARKACFWDFARHLDRLDAVLLTRLNNSTVQGIAAVLRRKKMSHAYPQIGHFFCNLQDRKISLSPESSQDEDSLIVSLAEEGREIVSNLRHLALKPHPCYRDGHQVDPVNLYHKVGHGKLDMYVISPARDSKVVKEFLAKWQAEDSDLFASASRKIGGRGFDFPLQNLVSICALLVWQPANPDDTITRILFPGSTPQDKVFEGLEKLRHLEFLKHPVCSARTVSPSSSTTPLVKKILSKTKTASVQKQKPFKAKPIPKEAKPKIDTNKLTEETIETKQEQQIIQKDETVEKIDKEIMKKMEKENGVENIIADIEKIEKIDAEVKKATHRSKYDMKNVKSKVDSRAPSKSIDRKKGVDKKTDSSPPVTPKKNLVNGTAKVDKPKPAPKAKISPTATPAKSAKEANNRKVVEARVTSRITSATKVATPRTAKKEEPAKTERKPISRRSKAPSPAPKATTKPDSVPRKVIKKLPIDLLEKASTDSTVSTPSADADTVTKQRAVERKGKRTQESKTEVGEKGAEIDSASKDVDSVETDTKAVKEQVHVIGDVEKEPLQVKLSQDSTKSAEECEEEEEYLIVTKEESVEGDEIVKDNEGESLQDEVETKDETEGEGEIKKLKMDEQDSEKKRKILEEGFVEDLPHDEETKQDDKEDEIGKKEDDAEEVDKKTAEPDSDESVNKKETATKSEAQKLGETDEGVDIKETGSKELTQPDEKFSTTVETSATTAPTLPEDERVPLEGLKEEEKADDDVKEVVEEKYIKEETKENVLDNKLDRPEQPTSLPQPCVPEKVLPLEATKTKAHARDLVKTPDEVADLPVHEEVDPSMYASSEFNRDLQPKGDESGKQATTAADVKTDPGILKEEDEIKAEKSDEPEKVKKCAEEEKDAVADIENDAAKIAEDKAEPEEAKDEKKIITPEQKSPPKSGSASAAKTSPVHETQGIPDVTEKETAEEKETPELLQTVTDNLEEVIERISKIEEVSKLNATPEISPKKSGAASAENTSPEHAAKEASKATSPEKQSLEETIARDEVSPGKTSPEAVLKSGEVSPGKTSPEAVLKSGEVSPGKTSPEAVLKSGEVSTERASPEPVLKSEEATPGIASPEKLPKSGEASTGKASPEPVLKSGEISARTKSPEPILKSGQASAGKMSPEPVLKSGEVSPGKISPEQLLKSGEVSPGKISPEQLLKSGEVSPGKISPEQLLKSGEVSPGKISPEQLLKSGEISRGQTSPETILKSGQSSTGKASPELILKSGQGSTGKASPEPILKSGETSTGKTSPDLVLKSGELSAGKVSPELILKSGQASAGKCSPEPVTEKGETSARNETPEPISKTEKTSPEPKIKSDDAASDKSTPEVVLKSGEISTGIQSPELTIREKTSGVLSPESGLKSGQESTGKSTPEPTLQNGKISPEPVLKSGEASIGKTSPALSPGKVTPDFEHEALIENITPVQTLKSGQVSAGSASPEPALPVSQPSTGKATPEPAPETGEVSTGQLTPEPTIQASEISAGKLSPEPVLQTSEKSPEKIISELTVAGCELTSGQTTPEPVLKNGEASPEPVLKDDKDNLLGSGVVSPGKASPEPDLKIAGKENQEELKSGATTGKSSPELEIKNESIEQKIGAEKIILASGLQSGEISPGKSSPEPPKSPHSKQESIIAPGGSDQEGEQKTPEKEKTADVIKLAEEVSLKLNSEITDLKSEIKTSGSATESPIASPPGKIPPDTKNQIETATIELKLASSENDMSKSETSGSDTVLKTSEETKVEVVSSGDQETISQSFITTSTTEACEIADKTLETVIQSGDVSNRKTSPEPQFKSGETSNGKMTPEQVGGSGELSPVKAIHTPKSAGSTSGKLSPEILLRSGEVSNGKVTPEPQVKSGEVSPTKTIPEQVIVSKVVNGDSLSKIIPAETTIEKMIVETPGEAGKLSIDENIQETVSKTNGSVQQKPTELFIETLAENENELKQMPKAKEEILSIPDTKKQEKTDNGEVECKITESDTNLIAVVHSGKTTPGNVSPVKSKAGSESGVLTPIDAEKITQEPGLRKLSTELTCKEVLTTGEQIQSAKSSAASSRRDSVEQQRKDAADQQDIRTDSPAVSSKSRKDSIQSETTSGKASPLPASSSGKDSPQLSHSTGLDSSQSNASSRKESLQDVASNGSISPEMTTRTDSPQLTKVSTEMEVVQIEAEITRKESRKTSAASSRKASLEQKSPKIDSPVQLPALNGDAKKGLETVEKEIQISAESTVGSSPTSLTPLPSPAKPAETFEFEIEINKNIQAKLSEHPNQESENIIKVDESASSQDIELNKTTIEKSSVIQDASGKSTPDVSEKIEKSDSSPVKQPLSAKTSFGADDDDKQSGKCTPDKPSETESPMKSGSASSEPVKVPLSAKSSFGMDDRELSGKSTPDLNVTAAIVSADQVTSAAAEMDNKLAEDTATLGNGVEKGSKEIGEKESLKELKTVVDKIEKDDINEQVKKEDNTAAVKRMLVTASSEDGGAETEICAHGSIVLGTKEGSSSGQEKEIESDDEDDDGDGDFSSLIKQAKKEYNLQRSRIPSANSSESSTADDAEPVKAQQEISLKRTRKVSTKESKKTGEDGVAVITTTKTTVDKEEQLDGSYKVTTTVETIINNGKSEEKTVHESASVEKSDIEDEEVMSPISVTSQAPGFDFEEYTREKVEEFAKKEESKSSEIQKKESQIVKEDSRRTSASSIISQEDLVSRMESRLDEFKGSSSSIELSPLKTTYITSQAPASESEALMTSSFYGCSLAEEQASSEAYYQKEDILSTICMKGIPEAISEVSESQPESPEERIDFAKALDEHRSARGEDLGPSTQPAAKQPDGSSSKDPIAGWGKPLGLPSPPKNAYKPYFPMGQNISTTSSLSTPSDNSDSVTNWGQPMSLPQPAPPTAVTTVSAPAAPESEAEPKDTPTKKPTPKLKSEPKVSGTHTPNRRAESPARPIDRSKAQPLYVDLTYVPHHGNSYYSNVEFFKRVRARYYVFSGTEPSKEVYNALLEAKQSWEEKDLEVTIIPTYDTDVLGYWVAENEETLAKHKIDLSPSASRCTINLQDHETSCSAYRLEF